MLAVQEGQPPSVRRLGAFKSDQDSTPLVGRIRLRWQTRQRNNSLYKAETIMDDLCMLYIKHNKICECCSSTTVSRHVFLNHICFCSGLLVGQIMSSHHSDQMFQMF